MSMSDNKIIRAWDKATDSERFVFLCDMNKRYRASSNEHGGLITLHRALMIMFNQIKELGKDDRTNPN